MSTPEGKVKAKFRQWMKREYAAAWIYSPVSNGMGKHGIPDFICCVPCVITQDMVGKQVGLFAGVETKAQAGVVAPLQALQIAKIREADGYADVVRGVGADFERFCTDFSALF